MIARSTAAAPEEPRRGKRLGPVLLLLALAALIALAGCRQEEPPKVTPDKALVQVPDDQWPILADDLDADSLYRAALNSLAYLRRVPADRQFRFADRKLSAAQMIDMLERLKDILYREPDPIKRTEELKKHFVLLESVGGDGEGKVLMTGYYEPVLQARKEPNPTYKYPLYAVPEDLVTVDLGDFSADLPKKRLVGRVKKGRVVPYWDREAIDYKGALKDKAQPLAWLDDPVEAFFLHIQGSGQVVFADGSRLRLGFAAANGQPYRSIGKLLLDEELMNRDEMSMQGIRKFLAENPTYLRRVLGHNPSYVFFRPLAVEGDGPLGCYGVPVTPGRSIATDRRYFPGLALGYVLGETPAPEAGTRPLGRFVFNQDTGGAIRGPGRLDLYYGSGDLAGDLAGRMKYDGRLYFLFPRQP